MYKYIGKTNMRQISECVLFYFDSNDGLVNASLLARQIDTAEFALAERPAEVEVLCCPWFVASNKQWFRRNTHI